MVAINKFISSWIVIYLYFIITDSVYISVSVVSNNGIINNISGEISLDIIYDNYETSDLLVTPSVTNTAVFNESELSAAFLPLKKIRENQDTVNDNVPMKIGKNPFIRHFKERLDRLSKDLDERLKPTASPVNALLSPAALNLKRSSPPVHNNASADTVQSMAISYFHQMFREVVCKEPKAKVIKVKDIYSDVHKTYLPSCIVLHRCSEDTGCCSDITKKCSPSKTQEVTFYFTVNQFVEIQGKIGNITIYEPLTFVNHTVCKCRATEESSMPRDEDRPSSNFVFTVPDRFDYSPRCLCPNPYIVNYEKNGNCVCNCNDDMAECLKYKKGNQYFNYIDRNCIASGQCLTPSCQYGMYVEQIGRCPTKYEKFDADDNI